MQNLLWRSSLYHGEKFGTPQQKKEMFQFCHPSPTTATDHWLCSKKWFFYNYDDLEFCHDRFKNVQHTLSEVLIT